MACNKEIMSLTEDLISDCRNSKIGKSQCFLFQNEETFPVPRLLYMSLNDISIFKNKFLPAQNIVGLARFYSGKVPETLEKIISFFKNMLIELGVEEDTISINSLYEVYVNQIKIMGGDYKIVEDRNRTSLYYFFYIFINRDPLLDNKIRDMQVKSTYGYISEFCKMDYNSFFYKLKKEFFLLSKEYI